MLESRVSSLDASAREAVAGKKTSAARAALRSKKLASTTLDRRRDTLNQLQDVYTRIEAAADNVEIVKVMQASASVLRDLNREVGGAEGVQDVADKLREEMETADEVNGVLAEGAAPSVVDEGEVDEEFEALEREEKEKKEREEAEKRATKERKEAEATRKRLEELEKLDAARKAKEDEQREGKERDAEDKQEAEKDKAPSEPAKASESRPGLEANQVEKEKDPVPAA